MNAEAEKMIAALGLAPLPQEGGFFRQTWLSPERGLDGRPVSSAILFLLTPDHFSALHRLRSTEQWYFHAGDSVEHVQLNPADRSAQVSRLGSEVLAGQRLQLTVPHTTWQGARLQPVATDCACGWALLSCGLAPGWDDRDFELGGRRELLAEFPEHTAIITTLTRTDSSAP